MTKRKARRTTTRKRAGQGAGSARNAARPRAGASRTFYDAIRKCVVDENGNEVTVRPVVIVAESPAEAAREYREGSLDAPPVALAEQMRLYNCETADENTIARLAKLAGCTIAELEYRRRGHDSMAGVLIAQTRCADTGKVIDPDRRRCLRCPGWSSVPDDGLPF